MAMNEDVRDFKGMFPDDLKEFVHSNEEGSFVLLDVRQPIEYEEAHLPGATSIPLPQLADSLTRLDPEKAVIVYCAVGGRSRMAAHLMVNHGFRDVYHLVGGIEAWEEPTATGPREFHLQFVRGDETMGEIVALGYRMEEGLRRFHEEVQNRTTDRELSDLLTHLIKAEESHKNALLRLLPTEESRNMVRSTLHETGGKVMEGGIDIEDFLERNEPFLQTVQGYLDLAMMIETQALDLYLRMARECEDNATSGALFRIAEEEKAHLALLGHLLEEKYRSRG